jgi:hypothetical protein
LALPGGLPNRLRYRRRAKSKVTLATIAFLNDSTGILRVGDDERRAINPGLQIDE